MKYIMYEHENLGVHIPIIFPDNLVHSIVNKHMQDCFREHNWEVRIASAGEVSIEEVSVSGLSETLKKVSRAEDAQIIRLADYGV